MKKILSLITLVAIGLTLHAEGYKVGDAVADFSLKNVDGKMLSTKDLKDSKGIIVVFTCNHCPFAQAYEQRIMSLDKKYRALGYPVVAISPNDPVIVPDDSYENMVARANEMKYSFPYLFDETQNVAKAYGATRTPHVYLLQRVKDKFVVKYIGAIDNNTDEPEKADKKYVEEAVNALLDGKLVVTTETKAIGCTIKWKKTSE